MLGFGISVRRWHFLLSRAPRRCWGPAPVVGACLLVVVSCGQSVKSDEASEEKSGAGGGVTDSGTAGRSVGSGGSGGRAGGGRPNLGVTMAAAGEASPSGGSGATASSTSGGGRETHGGAGAGGRPTEAEEAGKGGDDPGSAGAGEGRSTSAGECVSSVSVAGPIVVESQADLELLRGAATVRGDLTIRGDVSHLAPLHCLKHVEGALRIAGTTALENVDGLEALTTVDGWLAIGGSCDDCGGNAALSNVEALSGVTTATDIIVAWNAVLPDIGGLNSVTNSDLRVFSNPALVSISGLRALTSVPNGLDLRDNPLLTDISGLSGLTTIGNSLTIRNVGLEDLDAFSKLEKAPFVDIEQVPSLIDISGFAKLSTVESMMFYDVSMPHLHGLESLRTATSLSVQGDPELVDLAGLENLESADYFVLSLLPQLESLSKLESLEAIESDFQLWKVPKVRNLEGLGRISSVGYLSFYYTGLESLRGLDALTTVIDLTISDNDHLLSLDGLESLQNVSSLSINYNGQLPTCAAKAFATLLGAAGASILGNDDAGVCAP